MSISQNVCNPAQSTCQFVSTVDNTTGRSYIAPVTSNYRNDGYVRGVNGKSSKRYTNTKYLNLNRFVNMKRRGNKDYDDSNNNRSHPPIKRPNLSLAITSTIKPPPEEYKQLTQEMIRKFSANQQTYDLYLRKMKLRNVLVNILRGHYPMCGLFVVGSSLNGFGCNTSDVDLCFLLSPNEIDQKTEATVILRNVRKIFKKYDYLQKLELITAKVPILKFRDRVSGVEVDLNINNSVGIRNTHLLRCYSRMDKRVRPLVLIVKMWARIQDINDAKCMTISSYSLTLMVIHYLQCGVSPPVLPSLQKLYPFKFSPHNDVHQINIEESVPKSPLQNTMCLGELLIGFLDYYTNRFDFSREAISVRVGTKVPKVVVQSQQAKKNNPGQWKCLCIEEPFDYTNTARSVYDDDIFSRVKLVFQSSYNRLRETKQLGSILHC